MKVTIPSIEEHAGNPTNTMEIFISDKCPVCGGQRGKPHKVISWDGSRRLEVDGWENPCGHIEKYSELRKDHYIKEEIVRSMYESTFVGDYNGSVNKTMNQLYYFPAMEEYATMVLNRYKNSQHEPYTTGL